MRLGTKRTHLGWDWDAKEAISDAIGMQKDRSRMGLGAKGGWDWDMKGSIRIGMQKDRFRDAPGPISDGVGMQEDRFRMGFRMQKDRLLIRKPGLRAVKRSTAGTRTSPPPPIVPQEREPASKVPRCHREREPDNNVRLMVGPGDPRKDLAVRQEQIALPPHLKKHITLGRSAATSQPVRPARDCLPWIDRRPPHSPPPPPPPLVPQGEFKGCSMSPTPTGLQTESPFARWGYHRAMLPVFRKL
jgi:hypothetical protein